MGLVARFCEEASDVFVSGAGDFACSGKLAHTNYCTAEYFHKTNHVCLLLASLPYVVNFAHFRPQITANGAFCYGLS